MTDTIKIMKEEVNQWLVNLSFFKSCTGQLPSRKQPLFLKS
jgi:hypothetical protein